MENNKNKLILGSVAGVLIIISLVVFRYFSTEDSVPQNDETPVLVSSVMMPLFVYVQDKDSVISGDCSTTKRVQLSVPKTTSVANVSLKILFDEELSAYGSYSSVSLINGVVKVMLKSDSTPSGATLSSLSSCQSRHLMSVLQDTLLQYKTIKKVELHAPNGRIEF